MSKERVFLKKPILFEKDVYIYPPSVNDILDNELFPLYKKCLTTSREDLEDNEYDGDFTKKVDIEEILSPLEFLLVNVYHNDQVREVVEKGIEFFTKKPVMFSFEDKTILIGDLKTEILNTEKFDAKELLSKVVILNENNFEKFQNAIRYAMGEEAVPPFDPTIHPRIRLMKAKARYRDKIKIKKQNGLSLFDSLVSICCMGIGLTPLNIGEISYASVSQLIERYMEKDKYRIDIDSLLAGADSKKVNPKNWIRNLDE